MKKSLSGIKPTGILHLGNYFGAARQFVQLQDEYKGYYFIADYHTLNSSPEPSVLQANTYAAVMDYLAFGLDPKKSTIFLQSDVPETIELAFLLGNVTPMGLLQRAHSYKDKLAKDVQVNVGLFYYPLLMAADILLYDADIVPVGKDQKQHVEIARDIAIKFNLQYGEGLIKVPEPLIHSDVAIVPGTDGQKMSKSYSNTIEMFAGKKQLKKQIMGIVTDSTPLEESKDPEKCNVFALYKLFASKDEIAEIAEKYRAGGFGYGHAKKELLNKVMLYFGEMREKRLELEKDTDYIKDVLHEGAIKAREHAHPFVAKLKEVVGLVGNIYSK